MKPLITPSILSADFGKLQEEIDSVAPFADWLQLDIMDGHFVPNISFGVPVIKSIKTSLLLDAHLMVTNPGDHIEELLKLGVKNITFHAEEVETTAEREALIERIRADEATAGIALNPATPVSAIEDVVNEIDLVLIMSVYPGFGGQEFLTEVLEKITELRGKHPALMIQIDGGIDPDTAKLAVKAGANNLVAGTAIFGSKNRRAAIEALRGN